MNKKKKVGLPNIKSKIADGVSKSGEVLRKKLIIIVINKNAVKTRAIIEKI